MKRKIVCLFLAIFMLVGAISALTACGKHDCAVDGHIDEDGDKKCDVCKTKIKHKHVDENNDGVCDTCNASLESVVDYPWDETPLVFQMSHHSSGQQLPSGCQKYLAGESTEEGTLYDMISERNTDAYYYTEVTVEYRYYDDNVADYAWGKSVSEIYDTIFTNAPGSPDMYCNFQYDLIGVYLRGVFANLKSTNYGDNYFEFMDEDYDELENNRGYMYEYMESTTLNKDKMYILASDYFLDLIRAFFVVPVNIALMNQYGPDVTGDYDGNGKFSIDDFYAQVKDKGWTYDLMIEYGDAVYKDLGGAEDKDIHDQLGFAIGTTGLSSTAMVYTTEIDIIKETRNPDTGIREFEYPDTEDEGIQDLFALADALSVLFSSRGILYGADTTAGYGTSADLAIRKRFCDGFILFGGTICIGALEYEMYQTLKNNPDSGFGVVPVPLWHEIEEGSDENYLTTIHNLGRPGAIAWNTTNFSQCSAFLNYQSTHSTDILNFYYDYQLQYNIADGTKGTVEMLQYIRYNVRSAFDKTFEDALGLYDADSGKRWHVKISKGGYQNQDMRNEYDNLIGEKKKLLNNLYKEFDNFPE